MVEINRRERIIRAKILYYGPPAGGKTTNLIVLHRLADPPRRGELVSVNSTQDRTILLDLLPMKTPAFQGYDLRLQIIAVPGQSVYAASRSVLLKGADSIVFVANSAADRWEETLHSLSEMSRNLLAHGFEPSSIPVVFQYNKRDLPDLTPLAAMDRTLNARHSDSFPAVAIREEGVLETFAAVLRRTMADLATRYQIGDDLRSTRSAKAWAEESLRIMFRARTAVAPSSGADGTEAGLKVQVAVGNGSPRPATSVESQGEPLVESYAEAAAKLALEVEQLREERDLARRRSEQLALVVDAAQRIFDGGDPQKLLRSALETIGRDWGAIAGSLAIAEPGCDPDPRVLWNLVAEPLCSCGNGAAGSLAKRVLDRGEPVVVDAGNAGPFAEVLDRVGGECAALVAVPVQSRARPAILTFYLSSNAPLPGAEAMIHLHRLATALAAPLDGVAGFGWSDPQLVSLGQTPLPAPSALHLPAHVRGA